MSAKRKNESFTNELIRLAGVLFLICAVVAALLGYVDGITRERIAAIGAEKTAAAMESIIPGADFTEATTFTGDANVRTLYEARTDGKLVGVCVQVAPGGFGGEILTIVGVDLEGKVLGVSITKMSETAGLGSKAANPEWLAQYVGMTGPLKVVKRNGAEQEIDALTSATITSVAVTNGVQSALDAANNYMGGAGK